MDFNDIVSIIKSDSGLSSSQKEELLGDDNKKKLAILLSGASGAAIGLALAKYKNMSRPAQVVLSALGFGAGMLVYKYWHRERFAHYDSNTKMYNIDNK
jgi:hypothetical protein